MCIIKALSTNTYTPLDDNYVCIHTGVAFDSVPHRPLLDELKSIGLSEYLVKWICSYLSNREQHVALNGQESTSSPVISGLPQGSVLGPLLFLLYIKDLANGSPSENWFVSLYADDLLYKIITNPRDYVTLQSDINSVADWIIMLLTILQ